MGKNSELLMRWYNSYDQGDFVTPKTLAHENIEFNVSENFPLGGRHVGAEDVLDHYFPELGKLLDQYFENWKLIPERLIESEDTVVSIGRYTATVRKTGDELVSPFVHVWEVRDGKLAKTTQYVDTLAIYQAMNALD